MGGRNYKYLLKCSSTICRHMFYVLQGTQYMPPSYKSHNDHMRRDYYPILQIKKLGSKRLNTLTKVTQLEGCGARIPLQACPTWKLKLGSRPVPSLSHGTNEVRPLGVWPTLSENENVLCKRKPNLEVFFSCFCTEKDLSPLTITQAVAVTV